MKNSLLEINDLTVAYSKIDNKGDNPILKFFRDKKKSYTLLRNVNINVFKGEYLGLVGESGCGKSLTMKSIFGMIDFEPGIVNGNIKITDNKSNDKIQILDTSKRKIIKNQLMQTYFMFDHFKVDNHKVIIPNKFKIDKEMVIFIYNDQGKYQKLNIKNNSSIIEIPEKYKNYKNGFILGRSFISINNKQNIKDILDASKKHSIPGKYVSIILQDPLSFLNPYWSMLRQMENLKDIHGKDETNDIESILSFVKLNSNNFKRALPRELSGGQGQRAMIVLSSLTKPKLLIADEPTTGLDVTLKKIVVEKFKGLKKQISDDFSMIFISHDLNMVRRATDRMNVMYKGIIIENGKSDEFINAENHHPYTTKLINITKSNFTSSYISDIEDVQLAYQGGCSYYELCEHKLKDERCSHISPPPISIKDGKILVNEDPSLSWTKCWAFLKENK